MNTLKSFRERSEENIKLKKNDIFFIDIGPVFEGHEGDYGETFVTGRGEDHLEIKRCCERVFKETAKACREDELTGIELYRFAEACSQRYGYELNLKMSGHRLGDFPHAVNFKGKLGEVNITPKENLWVLEILIKHPQKSFGAFFEDII